MSVMLEETGKIESKTIWPLWEKLSFAGLLVLSFLLYVWNVGVSGWANQFYSSAVLSSTKNWEAFFFGSSDIGNSITVDKPPASLWVMDISVKLFGFNSWSILVPQALLGVGTITVVYFMVRKFFPNFVALTAGLLMLTVPIGSVVFRYNNPDALLVFLITLAAFFILLGIQSGKIRWVLFAGVCFGFAFLTKEVAGLLSFPGLFLVYIMAAPGTLHRRIWYSIAGFVTMIISAGWWVAFMVLTPVGARPYAAGSTNNNFFSAVLGYNGFNRLSPPTPAKVPEALRNLPGAGEVTTNGNLTKLLTGGYATSAGWLIPLMFLIFLFSIFLFFKRSNRGNIQQATILAMGWWFIPTALVFSLMSGTFHTYYLVALAPCEAVIVAVGVYLFWQHFKKKYVRWGAAILLGINTFWYLSILSDKSFVPVSIMAITLLVISGVTIFLVLRSDSKSWLIRVALAGIVTCLVLVPAFYSVSIVNSPLSGPDPGVGVSTGSTNFVPSNYLLNHSPADLVKYLKDGSSGYRWVGAAPLSANANYYQLISSESVMPIGGFVGTDRSPTFTQFKDYVNAHQIHYYLITIKNNNVAPDKRGEIFAWVSSNFSYKVIDGITIYDLSHKI